MRRSMCILASCLLALAACGDDDDDSSDNSQAESGESGSDAAGAAGAPQAGSGESSGSAAGASAGAGGSVSGSSTTEVTEVDGGAKLSEVTTDAQANGLCQQLADRLGDLDLDKIKSGTCTLQGLVTELSSQGSTQCETARDQCAAQDPAPASEQFVGCKASDFPKCADVTVDEYLECQHAQADVYIDYFGSVTCDTDPTSLGEAPAVPAACTGVYERCPELGSTT